MEKFNGEKRLMKFGAKNVETLAGPFFGNLDVAL